MPRHLALLWSGACMGGVAGIALQAAITERSMYYAMLAGFAATYAIGRLIAYAEEITRK